MSDAQGALAFIPIDAAPLPRPLQRFGNAFPPALAEAYASGYAPRRGFVLDPLAHPRSAADAVERFDRLGIARSPQPLGAWARRVVGAAPTPEAILASLERVAGSELGGVAHRVTMRELYRSRCATCRAPVVVEAFLWERDAPGATKKAFRCGVCAREGRALLIEPVSAEDEERARAIEPRGLAYWQFVERFGGDPEAQALGEGVAQLYTPRNLVALMATLRAIETSADEPPGVRDVLALCLLEVLVSGSRLNAVAGGGGPLRIERGRPRRGHAAQSREVNVWLEYERTVRELATWLGQSASARTRPAVGLALGDRDVTPADLVLFEAPVEEGLGAWSVVATFLLLRPETAAGLEPESGRVPGRERLLRALRQAFIEGHRGSRPGTRAVLYLPRAELASLAACALAGAGAGYRLRGVAFQPDALPTHDGSAAALLEFDRDAPLLKDQPPASSLAIEDAMRAGVRDAIIARGLPVSPDVAAAAAISALAERRLLGPLALARAGGTSELELFLDHFRSALGDARRSGLERITLNDQPAYALIGEPPDTAPLDDRVEWGVWGLLASARELETRAVLRRTYALFRGIETPDRELVERCLAAYGLQGDDGRWRLREGDALAARQADQTALAAQLVAAGHRLGFKAHVGRDLRRRPLGPAYADRGAILADLMSDAEKTASLVRHMRGPADVLDLIDLVWYDRGRMVFVWQLDWTARAHRSVASLGEAIPDDDRVFRFLAVADERRALLTYKLRRYPPLAELVRRRGWRFVKWGPLRAFATDAEASLEALEPVLGLDPEVEQAGQQLAFKW